MCLLGTETKLSLLLYIRDQAGSNMLQPLHSPCYDHYDHDNDQPSLVMTKVPIFLEAKLLHEDVLYLLQTAWPSGQSEGSENDLKWFPIPKNIGFKKNPKSLACSEVKLLHEAVLDLLQPIQAVLDLQVNLRVLKMVLNDFPYPKTWGLKKSDL